LQLMPRVGARAALPAILPNKRKEATMVTFEGKQGVQTYRAIALKHGLALFVKTGMRPNSAWTPSAMLRTAGEITGRTYKRGRYQEAITDLESWIATNGTTGGLSPSYVFYVDPGHGWLSVTRSDLVTLGLSARDFTTCSYVSEDGNRLYLEEDCDAGKFIQAYEAKTGSRITVTEKHLDSSDNFIRCRMRRNAAGEWKPFGN
jgi:hypothetical protein